MKQKARAVKTQEETFLREGVGHAPGEKAVGGLWPDLDVCVFKEDSEACMCGHLCSPRH